MAITYTYVSAPERPLSFPFLSRCRGSNLCSALRLGGRSGDWPSDQRRKPRDLRQATQSCLQGRSVSGRLWGCVQAKRCQAHTLHSRLQPKEDPRSTVSNRPGFLLPLNTVRRTLSHSRQNWAVTMCHREQGHSTPAPSSQTGSVSPTSSPSHGAGLTPTVPPAKGATRPMGLLMAFPGRTRRPWDGIHS